MSNEDNIEFAIPDNFLDKLYELTGSVEKYKGFLLVYSNEKGNPIIFNKCESHLVEMGLIKTLETYLEKTEDK
tara:strand:+ start:96 stop:314 length:219 start_codon:yes stop_codon:yes gene_type:complete